MSRDVVVNNGEIIPRDDRGRESSLSVQKVRDTGGWIPEDRASSSFSAAAAAGFFASPRARTHGAAQTFSSGDKTRRRVASRRVARTQRAGRAASAGRHYAKWACRNKGVKEAKLP